MRALHRMPPRLEAARIRLLRGARSGDPLARPYLADLLFSLIPVSDPGGGTLKVDRYHRLYIDEEEVAGWPIETLTSALYHEAVHLILDHPTRGEPYPPMVALTAAELEDNSRVLTEGFQFDEEHTPWTPEMFGLPRGLIFEEYAALLLQRMQQDQQLQHEIHAEGGEESGREQQGEGQKGKENAAQPPASPGKHPGQGGCGTCASPAGAEKELGPPEESGVPGISREEHRRIQRAVAEAIRQEAQHSRGNVPEYWRRWAEGQLSPQVPWQRELAAAVRTAVASVAEAVDYSYRRPSRRQHLSPNVVLPSMHRPVPEVAVVVDTSGSMSERRLAQALAELQRIVQAVGVRGVPVLAADAAVHTCRRILRVSQVELLGGGGTDMGHALQEAAKLRPVPDVVVVLTDGITPWGQKPKGLQRVIVGLLGEEDSNWPVPDWARVVPIRVG